jgi:hypothetical protein
VRETIVKNYESIEGAHICQIALLMPLSESKEPLSTTQISEKIAINSMGQLFKVSGVLKDSLENRLRKAGYVDGTDIANQKTDRKPIRMTLYSITPTQKVRDYYTAGLLFFLHYKVILVVK